MLGLERMGFPVLFLNKDCQLDFLVCFLTNLSRAAGEDSMGSSLSSYRRRFVLGLLVLAVVIFGAMILVSTHDEDFSGLPDESKVGLLTEWYYSFDAMLFDDRESQFKLGLISLYRDLDKQRAVKWLTKAACAGQPKAQEFLLVLKESHKCN